MRLALIGPSAPLRGGIAAYHDRLAAALGARGHDVVRVSYSRLYPGWLFPGRSQYVESAPAAPARAATVLGAAPEVLLDSLSPASWKRVATRVAGMDAVVCEWWHPFFAPALGTVARRLRRRGVPAIFVLHNLEPHEPMPGGTWLARWALAAAAGFVAQASGDVARLHARYPGRPVALVPPPSEAPPRCPHGERAACARALELPAATRRALFFGYVRAYKGVPTLLEALAATPADVQLVVAGEIYHRDASFYRARARQLGVDERVVLLDRFVADDEVACCFNATDIVVLPYWAGTQSGVVPLAMACGRAVVASAVGGIPDLVRAGETGLLVPPRDPAALARAMMQAFERAPAWGAAAVRTAHGHGWPEVGGAVESLLQTVVSAGKAPC